MSDNLRSKVIRLAHANPALRPHLLPLLKTAAVSMEVAEQIVRAWADALSSSIGARVVEFDKSADEDGPSIKAKLAVPNYPSAYDEEGSISLDLMSLSSLLSVTLVPSNLSIWADKLMASATGKKHHVVSMRGTPDELMRGARPMVGEFASALKPIMEKEILRRSAETTFASAIPAVNRLVQSALEMSGVAGPVEVWGHKGAMSITDSGEPFLVQSMVIEGLLTKEECRDAERVKMVYANTRKVLTKALSKFNQGGVLVKLSSKPASWSACKYGTSFIFYFKDSPVPNMKVARPSR